MDIDQAKMLLGSGDASAKCKAIAYLIEHSGDEAVKLLKRFLKDQDAEVREQARGGIKILCFPVVTKDKKINFDNFEKLMESPDAVFRTQVIMTARKFKQSELLPYYIGNLYEEEDEFVIATLLQAIGEVGDTNVIPTLSRFLNHASSRVRANAIEALGKIGGEKVVSLIDPLVDDLHHRVKICAVKVLWDLGNRDVLNKLEWMIKSELSSDRISAAFMLGLIDDPDTIPLLMEKIEDEDESVRHKVLQNLAYKINDPQVKQMFLDMMVSSTSGVSELVRNTIDDLKGKILCRNCGTLNTDKTNFCGKCGDDLTPDTMIAFTLPTAEEIKKCEEAFKKQQLKERALKQLASDQERGLKKRSWKKARQPGPVSFDDIDSI